MTMPAINRFERNRIEELLLEYTHETRRQREKEPLLESPVLRNLARNHSYRMSRKNKIWRRREKSRIPELIPNPIEATIAWTLITLGFLIAWIFALIGLLLLRFGRKGYKKKVREDVAMAIVDSRDIEERRYEPIARRLNAELSAHPEYLENLSDPDLKLTGVGVKRKKNAVYATQIFYG